MLTLPDHTTPAALAAHFEASKRLVADLVRELGCYRKIGNRVIMLESDVKIFMEAIKPCPSNSQNAATSGGIAELLPEGNFSDLRERLTGKQPKGSKRTSKRKRGNVVSMGRGQG